MIKLIESYTWQQADFVSKLEKLGTELNVVRFVIEGVSDDIYSLSEYAAIEGMKIFAQRVEDNWQAIKSEFLAKFPKFDFEKRFKIKIYDCKPTGVKMSFDEFAGTDYQKEPVNVKDYTKWVLANALLEPPYGLNLPIYEERNTDAYYETKTREYTALYRMFVNDFILSSEYRKENLIVYSWSDDWSNFFDAGKEWWGTYYCTVYNKCDNSIIVLGASATD